MTIEHVRQDEQGAPQHLIFTLTYKLMDPDRIAEMEKHASRSAQSTTDGPTYLHSYTYRVGLYC